MDPHSGVGGSPPGSPGGLTPPGNPPSQLASGGRSTSAMTAEDRASSSRELPGSDQLYGVPLVDGGHQGQGGASRDFTPAGSPPASGTPNASGNPSSGLPHANDPRAATQYTSAPHSNDPRAATQYASAPQANAPHVKPPQTPSGSSFSTGGMPAPSTSMGGIPGMSGSPFGMPLDLSSIGGMPGMSMSVLPEPTTSEMPYYLHPGIPGVDALGIESEPSRVEAYDGKRSGNDSIHRDLGRVQFDPYSVRKDFPILEERVHGGKRLVWLDNAATTQKPRYVIDRLAYFYEHENSNVHRAAHTLAARSTDAFEKARESARRFINAGAAKEIVWVRGATEGINLIAKTWGKRHVGKNDEIVITHLEHHANIVPWQMLCAEVGARLRVAPVDGRGDVILEEYEKLMGPRTKLVSIPHVSNALGTITPAKQMVEIAHRYGAHVMVDGAQAVSHMKVDVQDLGCDWYVFSGHKVFAPTGIGVVWGKADVLENSPPWQGGGNMIEDVTFEQTRYQPPPFRFEAGTGSIGDAVGLGAAIEYLERIGMDVIDRYEHELLVYGTQRLATVPGLKMIGTSPHKAGVLSFVLDGQRTEDVSAALDKDGIAVRSGHHCAQPILRRYGLEATVRASLAFYNICEDIDALVESLHRLQGIR
ncbi:MAG: SufS family cysteine desulfurase [Deltaproteobacteria bacterium]|nr:SufS family cysteine desulfurase [Deltaproteobacteria bacterium]